MKKLILCGLLFVAVFLRNGKSDLFATGNKVIAHDGVIDVYYVEEHGLFPKKHLLSSYSISEVIKWTIS